MDKRKLEVLPLKKVLYSEAKEESNWWDKEKLQNICHKKLLSLYAQLTAYKQRAEEAEKEKERVLESHLLKDTAIKKEELQEELLKSSESLHVITQLRKKIFLLTSQEPSLSPSMEDTPEQPKTQSPAYTQKDAEEIEEYLRKIENLEIRIETAISRHPPNFSSLIKSLEAEISELLSTNKLLSEKVAQEASSLLALQQEKQQQAKNLEEALKAKEEEKRNKQQEVEELQQQNVLLQNRVNDLYLTCEKINSTLIDHGRELEKENTKAYCSEECTKRIKELEGQEIDRAEEVAYLVRKYIDSSKENDMLKQERLTKKEQTHAPVAPQQTEDIEVGKDIHVLQLELKKKDLEYLERKSSAQYHKRKTIQLEAELFASKKTVNDMEDTNILLQKKLEVLQKKDNSPADKELELYQKMIRCAICCTNIKNAIIKKCMHFMCKECIDKRYATRQRTCPICGVVFSMNDVSHVYL
ncbi:hypothetical protein NEFER03_1509 [Nematocida sp. LUAm3]|nr:hypothetical protein NEFER03_1509 [Nematocida sp. LUAm3]KAI5174542.1 hypothetical protein NEFER02_0663 [Nematocida sp. LUAm2]KAI5178052.1 hypothetical protein NEFER01_1234 [Nematocida sp. LUAm1]